MLDSTWYLIRGLSVDVYLYVLGFIMIALRTISAFRPAFEAELEAAVRRVGAISLMSSICSTRMKLSVLRSRFCVGMRARSNWFWVLPPVPLYARGALSTDSLRPTVTNRNCR